MLDTLTQTAPRAERAAPEGYALGRFVLRRRERLLLAGGAPVALGSRAVEVLLALVEADGALLTKDALLRGVWAGVVVAENNLQVQVSALRRALGPEGRDWIATIPGRGYRFTGPVAPLAEERATVPAPARLPEAAERPPLSVLVLPFESRGGDPAGNRFADGLTDSLTTDLARALPGSTVIAQTTADTYRGHPVDVRAIGRAQGVRYVVEGSVLLAGERVRVNAQLVTAETGAHLWADRFDTPRRHGDDGDVLEAQDAIVARLSRSVGLQMVGAEARRAEQAEREHPDEGTAQDYVLRAHAAASQSMLTREVVETIHALYARALALEPGNADALAGIACGRIFQVVNGFLDETGRTVREEAQAREASLAEAEEKLARALAIAPGHLKALKGRVVLLRARGLFADAIAAAEALLARSPGDPVAHRETGLSLLYLGRAEEAVAWFRRADALGAGDDPLRWTWLQGLGRALLQLGRDAEAVEALRLAAASNPTFAPSHALLAAALALAGDDAAARVAMAEFRRAEPNTPLEALARRAAVPHEATDPLYQARNARVLEGLRRAASPAP
jgi:TolB-like protein/tetratricopeptide (TPR) repeat protein